jgi:hypothetical protein
MNFTVSVLQNIAGSYPKKLQRECSFRCIHGATVKFYKIFTLFELRDTTSMYRRLLLPSRSVTLPRPAHLCIFYSPVLVNKPHFFFRLYLFQFSTCFAHPCAHHQENQLYICTLDGHVHRVTHTRCRINAIDSPDNAHRDVRNIYRIGINTHEKRIVRQVYLQELNRNAR